MRRGSRPCGREHVKCWRSLLPIAPRGVSPWKRWPLMTAEGKAGSITSLTNHRSPQGCASPTLSANSVAPLRTSQGTKERASRIRPTHAIAAHNPSSTSGHLQLQGLCSHDRPYGDGVTTIHALVRREVNDFSTHKPPLPISDYSYHDALLASFWGIVRWASIRRPVQEPGLCMGPD